MPADVMLERLRAADRQTYETLLRYRNDLDAHTRRPTPDTARTVLRSNEQFQRAVLQEAEVLRDVAESAERMKKSVEQFLAGLSEPRVPPPGPGAMMAFGPVASGEYERTRDAYARVPSPY